MKIQDVSLLPPHMIIKPQERFAPEKRLWQSAPSAAQSSGGRLFCVYSADNEAAGEYTTNYSICAYSDDGFQSSRLAFYAYHDYDVRMSETLLFMSPEGVLYHFWTQSYQYFDGRGGIWCSVCSAPDAEVPIFSAPRRICDGFMANNPVVMKDGRWLFPSSVWTHLTSPFHPLPDYEKPSIWETRDRCQTMTYLGGTFDPMPSFTENTVFETKKGDLVMLLRTKSGIARASSKDGGKTWSEISPFVLPSPSSRFCVMRFPSGALVIITHYKFTGRSHLAALLSDDDGETFSHVLLLDERSDVSYPSGNMTPDGRAVVAYDRERFGVKEILLAVFTEEDIRRGRFDSSSFTKRLVCSGSTGFGV